MDPLDELYGGPLEDFVERRTELARTARAEGRRDDAMRLKAARKPILAAWAANRVVRSQREALHAVLEAADGLKEAMSDPKADRDSRREARQGHAQQVEEFVRLVGAELIAAGREASAEDIRRVRDTLQAASFGSAGEREAVLSGHLSEPPEPPSGFDLAFVPARPSEPPRPAPVGPDPAPADAPKPKARPRGPSAATDERKRRAADVAAQRQREREEKERRRQEEEARAEREHAQELAALTERQEQLTAEVTSREAEVARLGQALAEAEGALSTTRAALKRLTSEVGRLQRRRPRRPEK